MSFRRSDRYKAVTQQEELDDRREFIETIRSEFEQRDRAIRALSEALKQTISESQATINDLANRLELTITAFDAYLEGKRDFISSTTH